MAMALAFRCRVLQAARLFRRTILPEDKSFGAAASHGRALSLFSPKAFISLSVERVRFPLSPSFQNTEDSVNFSWNSSMTACSGFLITAIKTYFDLA
jgi:hypothetical protein